jgi:hypothetical protein
MICSVCCRSFTYMEEVMDLARIGALVTDNT